MQVDEMKMDFDHFYVVLGNEIINITHIQPQPQPWVFIQPKFQGLNRRLNL